MSREKIYCDSKGRIHKRHSFGSGFGNHHEDQNRHHHHHHHHHHHNRTRSARRIALIVALVLAAVLLVCVLGWRIMDAMGRANLYGNANSTGPDLTQVSADIGNTENEETTESQNWKAGWVRYQGKVLEYDQDILTFLFMGIDKKGTAQAGKNGIDGGQSDGLFLLVINPDTKQIDIVAINRNTMTDIDVYDEDGNYVGTGPGQICLQHGYGDGLEQSCERTEKAVSNLFYGLPIHGYCSIGIDAVGALADAVGGVTVPRMSFHDGQITYGEDETLFGSDAIYYVQHRDLSEYDSATFRLQKQKNFLKDFLTKLKTKVRENPASILTLYNSIADYIVTDVSTTELVYMADQIGSYTLNTDIYTMTGTTTHAEDAKTGHEEFVYDEQALYDMVLTVFYREVDPETGEVISADGTGIVASTESTDEGNTESTSSSEGDAGSGSN